jgi:hypothetical protein
MLMDATGDLLPKLGSALATNEELVTGVPWLGVGDDGDDPRF